VTQQVEPQIIRGSKKGLFRTNSQTITPRKPSTARTRTTFHYWKKFFNETPIEANSMFHNKNSIESHSKLLDKNPVEMTSKLLEGDDERIKTINDWYNWCRQDTTSVSMSTFRRNRRILDLTFEEIIHCIFAKEISQTETFEETEERKLGENDLNVCSQESLEVQFILSNGQEQEEQVLDHDSETSIKPGSPVKTNTIPDLQVESKVKPEPPQPRPRTIFLSENNLSDISQEHHQFSKVLISLYLNSENQSKLILCRFSKVLIFLHTVASKVNGLFSNVRITKANRHTLKK
jgi:hypothetical protein